MQRLDSIIKANAQVAQYHHLHISLPSSKDKHISFHLVFDDENITLKESKLITLDIEKQLQSEGFNHILIQVETKEHQHNALNCN